MLVVFGWTIKKNLIIDCVLVVNLKPLIWAGINATLGAGNQAHIYIL